VEIGAPWKITAPAKQTLDYLKKTDELYIDLSTADLKLHINHGGADGAEIFGMDTEAYPELPKLTTQAELSGLTTAIPRIIIAITNEKSRFSLNGALLETEKEAARFISTDGYRMSYVSVTYRGPVLSMLVSKRALMEVVHLGADVARIGWDENYLLFEHGSRRIISRKLTGNFPNYREKMPKEFPHAVLFDASALYKVLDRVRLFTDERSRAFRLMIADGKLTAKADVTETGGVTGNVPILGGWPSPVTIGFNVDYVMEFLNLAKGETVGLCYPSGTEQSDGIEQVVGCTMFLTTGGWQYIVMPIRL
jgi:DNA polymerase-3 subunit beta